MNQIIRPIPFEKIGRTGFFSNEPLQNPPPGYELVVEEVQTKTGRAAKFWNYYFCQNAFRWPFKSVEDTTRRKIDGFAPNLNKTLHIGHLRNLAIANAFSKMRPYWEFTSLFGTSVGCYRESCDALVRWFGFLDFHPTWYYDSLMSWDETIVPRQLGTGKNKGAMVWISPEGKEIVVMRSTLVEYVCEASHSFYVKEDNEVNYCPICGKCSEVTRGRSVISGRPNYVFHDIAFAATVGPDYYITGVEQTEHFRALGLADKHLPIGLVCGTDGKKIKSRAGDALGADEAMEMVRSRLDKTPKPVELAWNIIAWNFLHVNRSQNVCFDPEKWTAPDSPGLYIAYTHARLFSALARVHDGPFTGVSVSTANDIVNNTILTDLDLMVLGYAEYSHYWFERALEVMDTAPFANYVHDLCRVLTTAYNAEKIVGGRSAFQSSMLLAAHRLQWCMEKLGMFPLSEV